MKLIQKKHIPMIVILILGVILFGFRFLSPLNYEFLIYIAVIIFFFIVILFINKKYNFPSYVLWLLVAWALLHMAGGGVLINGHVLYQQMLIPLVSSGEWQILRFDQFIHAFGFFTTTIFSYYLLKPYLKKQDINLAIGILLIMIGCGFGALNEVIEFIVDSALPESGVGGYINTGLDLVSNLIGATLAVVILKLINNTHKKN